MPSYKPDLQVVYNVTSQVTVLYLFILGYLLERNLSISVFYSFLFFDVLLNTDPYFLFEEIFNRLCKKYIDSKNPSSIII